MKLKFSNRTRRAFTLLEVMIAIGIFFIGTFAILSLVSSSLANARRLQRPDVEAGAVLRKYAATNALEEGIESCSLADPDMLGKAYREYNCTTEIMEVASNRLFSVRSVIRQANGNHAIVSDITTVLYAPRSKPGQLDGGFGRP